MLNYVNKNLAKNEQIKKAAVVNKLAILGHVLVIAIFVILVIVAITLMDKYLFENEQLTDAPETVELLLKIIIALVLLLPSFVSLSKIFYILSLEVVVTNKRLIGKYGLISMKSIDIPLSQITVCNISCGFFGRIFKYETIEVLSAGMKIVQGNSVGLKLDAVSNARDFVNTVNACIEENKKQTSQNP